MKTTSAERSLLKHLGYSFENSALFEQALRHPSYCNEAADGKPDNQRLEWLGDAVLGLLVADSLYRAHPDASEGQLTTMRIEFTRTETLASIARNCGIGKCLKLGQGERRTGGAERPTVLADALEAFLGAVYLDGGLEAAGRCVDRLFDAARPADPRSSNPKGVLQERLQADGRMPEYRVIEITGPAHERDFEVAVVIDGVERGRGRNRTKQGAEAAAARMALKSLGDG